MIPRTPRASQAHARRHCTRWLFAVPILLGLSLVSLTFQALAQSDEAIWATPLNLSHSGAASSPVIVAGSEGTLRVLWWDQFDGLMVAGGAVGSETWSEPTLVPIFLVETVEGEGEGEEELVFTPIEAMPRIVAGAAGEAHAFWLEEADEETGARPLMHSHLAAGSASWSWAGVVAESAASFEMVADASDTLHLVYVRPLHTSPSPAGLYYRRSRDGGATWSAPATIQESRYFRLLSPETAYLRLAADDAGGVTVTWDDPRQEQVLLAHSADGGTTWGEPRPVGASERGSRRGRVIVVPAGQTLLLWEEPQIEGACGLYQAPVSELLAGTQGTPQQVLGGLAACPENERFLPAGEGLAWMVAGQGSDLLTLAIWNGTLSGVKGFTIGEKQWSEPRQLSLSFEDPELGQQVHLGDLQAVLVPSPSGQETEQAAGTLIVVGADQNGEVWITGSQVAKLAPIFAPPTPTPTPTSRLMLPAPSEVKVGAEPSLPVNLSRSGTASDPTIVAGADNMLRIFWWDRFDGLMMADGAVLALSVLSGTQEISTTFEVWSDPAPAPIFLVETIENEPSQSGTVEKEPVFTPIDTMPRIEADVAGRAHAFWLGEADVKTGARPLMHSVLDAGSVFWSWAGVVAESTVSFDVAADASGVLHLAYLRMQHTPDAPAGLYYRRSDDGGLSWGAPAALHQSRYFRLLTPEAAHVRLATDDAGTVCVTWDDPHLERLMLTHSSDGGTTWETPRSVGDPDEQPQRGQLIAVPGGPSLSETKSEVLLLWQDAAFGGQCSLYQASVNELLAGAGNEGRRILEGLTVCPENARFSPVGKGQALMVGGRGSDALTLAAWDGEQWSEPRRSSFHFEDPDLGGQVYLSDLQAALVQDSPEVEGLAGRTLIAVGTDGQGDVWVTTSGMGALELIFAPPPPWSTPVNFSESEALPALPAVAADAEGRVHVLWSESSGPGEAGTALLYAHWDGERWTRPTRVLDSPEGGAEEPSLAVVGDRLHAVWSGGPNSEILYSRAFLRDAYMIGGWSEPLPLSASTPLTGSGIGSWPDIAADVGGALHVVYAVPLNEGRGIYYVRSDDNGGNWSPVRQVFDAVAAGWATADYPRLAVDRQGGLHVVWIRAALSGSGLPQGVYYARSTDWGETWSEPLEVAEGAYTWPQVTASGLGQVHLLWNEAIGEHAWWHQWSNNGGQGWAQTEQVRGFGDVPGPVGLASDGAGTLHLTGLGYDAAGEPALLYMTWEGERWGQRETFRLESDEGEPGVAAALLPALGRLDVTFRGEVMGEKETPQIDLWHTGRAVPTAIVTPAPTLPPHPTATPLPTPTPTATPRPMPDFGTAAPPTSGGSMEVLLLGGGLAALIVAGIFGARLLWAGRR